MGKRGHGEGSIYRRESDGKWVGAVNLGFVDGKRRRKIVYGDTRRAVAEQIKAILHDQQRGLPVKTARQTVGAFLTRWLEDVARPTLRPRTFRSYRQTITGHLIPALGTNRLDRVTPQDVQAYLNAKRASGLSSRTVAYHRAILRKALNDALKWGDLARNVAALASPPKQEKPRRRYLTPPEARRFLDTVAGDRLEALFTVGLAMGLRQGECLGLRWADVDFEAGTVTVANQMQRVDGHLTLVPPKSEASRRTLPLPEPAVRALRNHRRRQLEDRVAAGPLWDDADLVFCTRQGHPLDARNVTRHFHRLRMQVDLPWLTFHGLRHGFASLLAAQGIHPRTAMELLGHSQLSLTIDVYSHVAPELAREAAMKIGAVLGG